jgi:hypothetical protein
MGSYLDIEFEQLVELAKKLPPTKWSRLKEEVEKKPIRSSKSKSLETFLLKAPTFSKKQISSIAKTRKAINQWRAK